MSGWEGMEVTTLCYHYKDGREGFIFLELLERGIQQE